MMKLWSVALVVLLAFVHVDADAKRMGGGKSVGQQSSNVTQRQATPSQAPSQAAPAQQAQRPATPNAAPQAAPKKPWGAMLGGLAAGLGLAWLAHSLGFGEAFANMLLVGLAIMAVLAIVGFIMRKKSGAAAPAGNSPFAFQGAGNATPQAPESAPVARQYNPEKVGNDASARPWEQGAAPVAAAAGGSMIGSALGGSQNWGVPEGFDTQGFLDAAKRNFVTLQAAWDRGDVQTLRSMMTDTMLTEVKGQLQDREQHREGVQPNQTDVVMLEAQLLGIEDLGNAYMASVEFSGMIREEANAGPSPFREVWNMTKPKDGSSGWLVAGLQALQ
ncbi:Tim44 domain-containing protein [Comamonas sp. 4034]|uniref:Tim44 domain-containing protein n=1 Tax=Comamonas sp. 4034 TaxID=3156455 RepID=UPI00320BEB6B